MAETSNGSSVGMLGRDAPGRNKVAVIIPYYQEKAGILRRAVNSVLDQEMNDPIEIVVVDDGSPVSAQQELEGLPAQDIPIRIICQPNAGPAAARNRGLHSVDSDTEFVAFLDSDDEWSTTHLQNALRALEMGYDFYFADFFHLGHTISAFSRAKRIALNAHTPLSNDESLLFRYEGNMFNQILTGNVIGTSTVVYRYRKFSSLRFREEFYSAGEDYLFWMDFSMVSDGFVFSVNPESKYGAGVNVYSGAGWGTDMHTRRIHNEMKYRKSVKRLYPLRRDEKAFVNRQIGLLREAFVKDVLHRMAHGRKLDGATLNAQAKLDLYSVLLFIPLAFKIAFVDLFATLFRRRT
jgi:succinoglycan biosynthesis protein ExoW